MLERSLNCNAGYREYRVAGQVRYHGVGSALADTTTQRGDPVNVIDDGARRGEQRCHEYYVLYTSRWRRRRTQWLSDSQAAAIA